MKNSVLLILALTIAACGGETDNKTQTPVDTSTKVRTTTVTPTVFSSCFQVHGMIQSDNNVLINSQIPGNIEKINVSVGENVKSGQTLVVINTAVISKSIDEIKTALDLANTLFTKQKNLWDQKIGSEVQYLQAKNSVDQLNDKLATLEAQRANAIIKAPFDGIVDEIMAKKGELASGMFPLIRLVNLKTVHVEAAISERYLKSVHKGMNVYIEFPAINDSLTAKISYVGQYINPANRTFNIRIEVNNKDGYLKPNLLAYLNILDKTDSNAIVIPTNIIQDRTTNPFVYVVQVTDSTTIAGKAPIVEGIYYKNRSQVLSGLSVGDEIIMDPLEVVDGIEIKPTAIKE